MSIALCGAGTRGTGQSSRDQQGYNRPELIRYQAPSPVVTRRPPQWLFTQLSPS